MSPQLLYGTSPPSWSRCSRQYITRFLDRGWGWCLDDPPVRDVLDLNSVPPGVLYSAAHQCRLQYGSGSLLCDDVDVRPLNLNQYLSVSSAYACYLHIHPWCVLSVPQPSSQLFPSPFSSCPLSHNPRHNSSLLNSPLVLCPTTLVTALPF
eukprot:XP_014031919.1 PREDICTED: A disintegrin and metalloproteinase with thrombospondin motifs 7-like [Salmo salar]